MCVLTAAASILTGLVRGYCRCALDTAFENYENYEDALKQAGFETLWTCAAAGCGQTMHWNTLNELSAGARSLKFATSAYLEK
jgi:hypothetical protein